MIPIAYNHKWNFDGDGFSRHLMEICTEHRKEKRALAFAFIVYDFQNPAISKVLKDYDYWQALNSISGKYLSVFYFNKPKLYENGKINESYAEDFCSLNLMTEFEYGSSPNQMNEYLKKTFNVEKTIETPFVIFFQTVNNDIHESFIVKLKNEKIEESFIELKNHIKNAVESIENVSTENQDNRSEIFFLIKNRVINSNILELIKNKIYKPISVIGTIGGFIKLF